jgi:hypothetical protein
LLASLVETLLPIKYSDVVFNNSTTCLSGFGNKRLTRCLSDPFVRLNYLPYFTFAYSIMHIRANDIAFHRITGSKFDETP